MDRHKWMYEIGLAEEAYVTGVQSFLKFVHTNRLNNGDLTICCPCADCKNLLKYSDMSPKQPGNDIDVYLASLIDEIKTLWGDGVDVYDACKKETFKLRAMIFCTISDFPAYGNLSGYSTKGKFACQLALEEKGSRTYPPPVVIPCQKLKKHNFVNVYMILRFHQAILRTSRELLDSWQKDIILTLCELEMYFPPSFFDIMVYLICHIVEEIKACGPIFLRDLYPFERYIGFLKGFVRNQAQPDASIVEGYYSEELIEFSADYLDGVKNIGIPRSCNEEGYASDPFILTKLATQVFIVKDLSSSRWHIVLQGKRCILGFDNVKDEDEYNQFDELPPFSIGIPSIDDDIENTTYLRPNHNEGSWAKSENAKQSALKNKDPSRVGGKRKKKVTIEDLEGMRAQMMEDMETIVRAKIMEELAVQGNNTTLQGPSIGHYGGHSTGHSTGVSAESVDTFDEIDECELMFVHIETECRVAKGVIYPSNGMLHGKSMDPGFLKIQVDTANDGWDEVIAPKPTDEVLGRMSSNDSMSLPTSIPPLTSPTTSAPVLCQMQEFPSQATLLWSGSKTITPMQKEDDITKKCMEVLSAWTGSKKAIPTQNGNNTIQECMELLLRRPIEIQRLASKFIERPKRDDQILVMSHPGMYVECFSTREAGKNFSRNCCFISSHVIMEPQVLSAMFSSPSSLIVNSSNKSEIKFDSEDSSQEDDEPF
nr:hypothetical protein [Tanacetum cinerariifolium]